jgi:NADH dehydrogenase (ubiquinone) Fe-S protein 6
MNRQLSTTLSRLIRTVPSKKNTVSLLRFSSSSSASTPALGETQSAVTPTASPPTPAVVPAAQAPNYPTKWSTNQRERPAAGSGPRFEQTAMELQPNPLSAMELVNSIPPTIVHGRRAVCDGGGGPLGHPKIYINLVSWIICCLLHC